MVEVDTQCDAAAQHIVGRSFYGKRTCSGGSLRIVLVDAAYKRHGVTEREVGRNIQVVVDTCLCATYLDDLIEVGNLITQSYRDVGCSGFYDLAGR